jgi:hypothetical protein
MHLGRKAQIGLCAWWQVLVFNKPRKGSGEEELALALVDGG